MDDLVSIDKGDVVMMEQEVDKVVEGIAGIDVLIPSYRATVGHRVIADIDDLIEDGLE